MVRSLLSIINFEGLSSDLPEWKKCGRTLFLIIGIPWCFIFLVAEWISWQAGDWLSLSQAAMIQTKDPNLIWYKYRGENFARYKLARVAIDRPDILIFGQSRSQNFRGAMFRPYSAYNLSSTCYLMSGFTDLLRHLPQGYNPKVIIMTCDFWLFSPVNTAIAIRDHALQNFTPSWKDKLDDLHDILVQLPTHPSLLLMGLYHPFGYPTLGMGAYLEPGGFRKDGSTLDQSKRKPTNKMQAFPNADVDYGNRMGENELEQFDEFVSEVQARGITLVCVQMPCYTKEVPYPFARMANLGELQDFAAHVRNGYFDKRHVIFFDFLSLEGYSDDSTNFLDSIHPNEEVTLAVLSKMADDPRFLALLPKLDVAAIKKKLAEVQMSPGQENLYPNEY